ncbi:MAG: hypothetical protein IT162_21990 [Bryobacterales bacterium]|nr:hypothetical protein [Bryobacterales bacterium]
MKILVSLALLSASVAPCATYYITVAGLGGDPLFDQRFTSLAQELDKLVRTTPDAKVTTLIGVESAKPRIQQALADAAKNAKAEDTLIVTLIGHGNYDGQDYKVNIQGPDVTAADLAEWMDRVPAQKQAVINTTSCSGASIDMLRRDNRVIVSATKAATERLATQFARFWVEAMRNPEADTDKNEVVSVLEAYRFADKKTVGFYETQKRLATEHAMLEDTGKGNGVRAPGPDNGHGLLAGQTPLVRFGTLQQAAKSPEKQALLKRREEVEAKIEALKYTKAAISVADYRKQLGALLLELAKVQEEIDR